MSLDKADSHRGGHDDGDAPATDLAAVYHERWQIEAVFDELKTHLRERRRTLRSKTAELVRQEFFGWVLAHYAVRWLFHTQIDCTRRPATTSAEATEE